jgi:hypothetical protein
MTTSLQSTAHTDSQSGIRHSAISAIAVTKPVSGDFRSRTRVVRQALFAALFTYHALAVTLTTLIPAESHLHTVIDSFFRRYLTLTGSDQIWAMFSSAPYYASYDVALIAEDDKGVRHEYGPVLPGLRPYDAAGSRDHKLFGAFTTSGYRSVLHTYFDTARRAIRARDGIEVRSLRLRYKTQRLHYASAVRKTGRISYPDVTETEVRRWRN